MISAFSQQGRDAFFGDLMVQSAILHRLALLGEACRAVSPEIRELHPDVPWPQIVAFRNVVIHEYFGIDLDLVWTIVVEHIPALGAQLRLVADSLTE
ncbi:MAG: DUF86 domain-containing protein [Bryobacterales bacterium]|nr:DUF86 domain-containing protein [Bryobacterales bacterium]